MKRSSSDPGVTADLVSVVTLNISGPSLERAERLVAYLLKLEADALVLTETRANPGTRLVLSRLEAVGYTVVASNGLTSSERGAAIAHRLPTLPLARRPRLALSHRLPVARVELWGRPVLLAGVYVPSRDASSEKVERKERFLRDLLRVAASIQREAPVIMMGDFNVVARSHEPRYAAFRSWEYDAFDGLVAKGYVDAHDLLTPGAQVHSWIGRFGDGYRYDYGFVSTELAPYVHGCDYDHSPRDLRLTDHAAVHLRVSADASAER